MAASTPSMCLRSDSDSVHSQTRDQASSRLGAAMRGRGYPARRPKLWRVGLGSLTRLSMEKFIIEGGTPLAGTITPAGNKNAALPGLAACLLTREAVVLRNIPPPGGDVIGRRRLDPHLDAFRALGAEVNVERSWFRLSAPDGLHACDFFMDEPSVMATENALMAAALTPGSTVIHNAAAEPHVQDLARLLMAMGARIEGIGSNLMIVHGQEELGGADYSIGPDYIEVGSFIALAACTGGELRIRDTVPDDLRMTRLAFERLGCRVEFEGNDVIVPPGQHLRIKSDAGDAISKIEDGPWPAFPADLTSIAVAMATQADGLILIHEKMFENRLYFVDKLVTMGARVIVCDPHRAVVSGPSRLHGERMECTDIRAGMGILIAALCAEGTSEIGNIRQIDRGYERIDERLRSLGARIERVAAERVPA